MSETALPTRPVSKSESLLREKFAESVAGQSDLMDQLARQLITLELAIPGLYAMVLKLTQGDKATVTVNGWFYLTFGAWLLALLLTLGSLIPRKWQVDPTIFKADPSVKSDTLSLDEFFQRSARYKRWLLLPACLLFWLGIVSAFFVLF